MTANARADAALLLARASACVRLAREIEGSAGSPEHAALVLAKAREFEGAAQLLVELMDAQEG